MKYYTVKDLQKAIDKKRNSIIKNHGNPLKDMPPVIEIDGEIRILFPYIDGYGSTVSVKSEIITEDNIREQRNE